MGYPDMTELFRRKEARRKAIDVLPKTERARRDIAPLFFRKPCTVWGCLELATPGSRTCCRHARTK